MTDIVERLRQVQGDNAEAHEAADEIERLQAENEKLRTAVRVAIKALEPFPPASILPASKRIIRLVKE